MLKFKVLNEEHELLEFTHLYEAAINKRETVDIKLPIEKLMTRDKIVGVYNKEQMVAGYCLSNTPHTLLENITAENKNRMEEHYPIDTCYDLGCIWKKGISTIQFTSVVWPRIVIDSIFFNLKRPNIIGYVLTGHGRTDVYNKAKPFYVQSSKVKNEINIFVFTRKNLVKAFLSLLFKEFSRPVTSMLRKPKQSRLSESKQ